MDLYCALNLFRLEDCIANSGILYKTILRASLNSVYHPCKLAWNTVLTLERRVLLLVQFDDLSWNTKAAVDLRCSVLHPFKFKPNAALSCI